MVSGHLKHVAEKLFEQVMLCTSFWILPPDGKLSLMVGIPETPPDVKQTFLVTVT